MVRPRKCRKVGATPDVTYFKPRGVPMSRLEDVFIPVEGFEALRLADHNGMSHEAAAAEMEVSRQTFGRILSSARQSVAKALVQGWALKIQGGAYTLADEASDDVEVPRAETPSNSEIISSPFNKKEAAMAVKIAISSDGPDLDGMLDPRFGRAAGFIVANPQTLEFDYIDNGSGQAKAQGAGIQAAETVAATGAEAVLSGHVGPKAFRALEAAGIKVVQHMENKTVRQAIEAYASGSVSFSQNSNGKGKSREGGHRQRQGRNR